MKPQKRTKNLVVEEVFDDIVVADMERDKAHHLNEMAAFVWQQCDGEKTPQQIATLVQLKFRTDQAEELVWMSLERLGQAHLLAERMPQNRQVLTRREMLKLATKVGIAAAMLPVVASMAAPRAVAQGSVFRRQSSFTFTTGNCTSRCQTSNCMSHCAGVTNCTGTGATVFGCNNNTCTCCCTCTSGPTDC